mmetsp:Transcript_124051/g.356168  ORF Transcript_124051/g.356168 Transcript_124051/m.356168 type:complete len:228 (+) Transcript_124051:730-1413(+)
MSDLKTPGDMPGIPLGALSEVPSKYGWARASSALSRFAGFFSNNRMMRSRVTSSTFAWRSGDARTGSRRTLYEIWSLLAADLANGCRSVKTMYIITPMDHMSHFGPYFGCHRLSLLSTSGAMKKTVPTASLIQQSSSLEGRKDERPKSMTLAVRRCLPSFSVSKQFSNLRSRCTTPSLWQYATAATTSWKSKRISSGLFSVGSSSPMLPPVTSSVTRQITRSSSKYS